MRVWMERHDRSVFHVGHEDAPIVVDRNAITHWLLSNIFNVLIERCGCRCRIQDDGHRHAAKPGVGHRSDVEPLLIVTDLNAVDPYGEIKKSPQQSVGAVVRLNDPVFGPHTRMIRLDRSERMVQDGVDDET